MTFGNAESNLPDADASRERLELETRVLAAALRQSLERGDTEGSSQAHQQIFVLLKASQDMGWEEPISLPPDLVLDRKRTLPDIDWGAPNESPIITAEVQDLPVAATKDIVALVGANAEVESKTETEAEIETDAEAEAVQVPAVAAPLAEDMEVSSNHSLSRYIPVTLVAAAGSTDAKTPQSISDYYSHLAVSQTADFNTIHKQFLRKVRPLLRRQVDEPLTGAPRKELLTSLQALWIAHDILCDAVTRTDYDFRRMGLRGNEVSDPAKVPLASRPQLRIGELLQCAGLLETTELEIAADMHKAMPELMFGAFLVKQGFIADEDLLCVLLGQQLLKTGDITVAQFQDAMTERATTSGDLGAILVERHYLTDVQLQEAYRGQSEETAGQAPVVNATVSLEDSEIDLAESLNSPDEIEVEVEVNKSQNIEAHEPVAAVAQELAENSMESDLEQTIEPGRFEPELIGPDFVAAIFTSDVSESPAEPDASFELEPAPAPVVDVQSAVLSWKDQLDWSTPEPARSDSPPDNASPVTISIELVRPAEFAESAESVEPTELERKPRYSLLDLMVGLETSERKKVEDEQNNSLMSHILQSSATTGDAAFAGGDDFAPPLIEEDEAAGFADEFAALNAAADEALDIAEHAGTVDNWGLSDMPEESPQTAPVFTPAAPVASPATPLTSPAANQAPSVTPRAQASKDRSDPLTGIEVQKESGSWQIVSIPASALASLLLDDEPEETAFKPAPVDTRADDSSGNNNPPFGGNDRRPKRRRTKS